MQSDWEEVKLGDIVSITGGLSYKAKFIGHGDSYLLGMGCVSNKERFLVHGARLYSGEYKSQHLVTLGDLVLATRQQSDNLPILGMPAILPETFANKNVIVGSNLYKVFNDSDVDNEFIYWLMKSFDYQSYIKGVSTGTTVRMITKSNIENYTFKLPPISTRKLIAKYLNDLDNKIELNRKMNQTLEEMAQTLFKSWFVDFDPVHALQNSNGEDLETIASDLGISKEFLELFPSEFEESELGMIPKGWKTSTIEDEVSIYGGATPSTKEDKYWLGGKNYWATPRDLSGLNSKVLIDTSRKITDDGVNKISSKQLPMGTILLSSRAPVGYIAYSTVPISINQGFIAMVCNKQLSNYFVMYWLDTAMSEIKNRAIGTTFAEISKSSFRPIKLVVPTQEILSKFNNQIQPMVDKIITNEYEIQTLQKTRDTLLPKLLSGEIEVSKIDIDNPEDT